MWQQQETLSGINNLLLYMTFLLLYCSTSSLHFCYPTLFPFCPAVHTGERVWLNFALSSLVLCNFTSASHRRTESRFNSNESSPLMGQHCPLCQDWHLSLPSTVILLCLKRPPQCESVKPTQPVPSQIFFDNPPQSYERCMQGLGSTLSGLCDVGSA